MDRFFIVIVFTTLSLWTACDGDSNIANNHNDVGATSDASARDQAKTADEGNDDDATPSLDLGRKDDASEEGKPIVELAALKAFPTAEGAGAQATGGRGGQIIYVTTTANTGPGSLREALRTDGPRTILFAVGGRFNVDGNIGVNRNGHFTLAGQTANHLGGVHITSEGTERDNRIFIENSQNMIFRYLDIKSMWQWWVEFGNAGRKIAMTVTKSYNAILDHCTGGWGSYSFAFAKHHPDVGAVGKYTMQRTLSHEGAAGHNVASLNGQAYSYARSDLFAPEDQLEVWNRVEDFDFHHNAFIGTTHRFPNTEGWENGRFRTANNYVYGWGSRLMNMSGAARNDIVNNVYEKGRYANPVRLDRMHVINMTSNISFNPPTLRPNIYIEGNWVVTNEGERFIGPEDDNWAMITHWANSEYGMPGDPADEMYRRLEPIEPATHPVSVHATAEVKDRVLANVGANVRFRDDGTTYYVEPIDEGYLDWARSYGGPAFISSNIGDGGLGDVAAFVYPEWPEVSVDLDTFDSDRDGLPNDWEILHGLDPEVQDSGGVKLDWDMGRFIVRNTAGYSNLEIYLADVAGDFIMLYFDI